MKSRLFLILSCLVSATGLSAQTIGVSNLGTPNSGQTSRYANGFSGVGFVTDASATEFTLDSVTLPVLNAYSINDFTVQIRANGAFNRPGTVIATLDGTTSPTAGDHTFTESGVILAPSTTYWVTWGFTNGAGGFDAPTVTPSTGIGAWSVVDYFVFSSNAGANWSQGATGSAFKFSVQATTAAVPEPSTYALIFGAGALGFAAWRRRRAAV